MKKRIALDQIKPGSRFSEDVFIDDKNLLVPANIAVKQKDLNALKRWGVAFVLTEGGLVDDTPAASAPEVAKPKPQGFSGSRELYLRYTELVDRLSQIYDKIRKSEAIETKAVDQISQGVLALVREERDSAISAILGSQAVGSDLARAGVNTAILSAVIGVTLKLPPYRLTYLVSGALLHDAGMLRIPDSIVKKKGALRPPLTVDETSAISPVGTPATTPNPDCRVRL